MEINTNLYCYKRNKCEKDDFGSHDTPYRYLCPEATTEALCIISYLHRFILDPQTIKECSFVPSKLCKHIIFN